MALYKDLVFRLFLCPSICLFIHQSINICVNPNFDCNVQVHYPRTIKASDDTWYKLALRDDNSDSSIHILPGPIFHGLLTLLLCVVWHRLRRNSCSDVNCLLGRLLTWNMKPCFFTEKKKVNKKDSECPLLFLWLMLKGLSVYKCFVS